MKWQTIFLLVPLFFLLTGCWDKRELEAEGFVVVMGLDKGPRPDTIKVTYQIANPQVGSSTLSQSQTEPPSDIVSIIVPNISSGQDTANTIVPRRIDLSHCSVIVIGSELAKSGELDDVLTSSIREPQLRRETTLIVSDEPALDFIENNKPKMETRPHKFYDFMIRRWKETGMVPFATFNRYFHRREIDDTLLLTILATAKKQSPDFNGETDEFTAGHIPELSGDPAQIIGSAVLEHGKMIDTLTGGETRIALVLRSISLANAWFDSFTDPGNTKYKITARVYKKQPTDIDIDVRHPIPTIHVTIPLKMEISSIPSKINYITDLTKQNELKKGLEKSLEQQTMALIKKTQTKYKDDPFLWSIDARKDFLTDKAYEAYHWKEKYPEAKVSVTYKITFIKYGKQYEPVR